MIDFSLEPELIQLKDSVYRYATDNIIPIQEKIQLELDEKEEFAWPIWEKFKEFGLLGFPFPTEYGGQGASALATTIAWEALGLAGVDGGMVMSLSAHTILCGVPLMTFGSEDQKKRYLTKLATGEMIGCFAITEPHGGSDSIHLKTTAVKKGDRWILNGSKLYITNAPIGDLFLVLAATDKSLSSAGITAFLVEKGFKGFSVSRKLQKMGNRLSPTGEIVFEDCEVPEENVLGEVNMGFVQIVRTIFGWERSVMLSPSVGSLETVIKALMAFANNRTAFGKPISYFQAIQKKIVDMKVTLEVARSYLYTIAWHIDRGELPFVEASSFKLFWGDSIVQHIYEAIQILGGLGYMRESKIEKGYRDVRLITIGGGTSEVQRTIVARAILGLSGKEIE
ncbi:MAG: acyl-CoA dehydrogenase family protein [Candidatus Calescibacterium sp.]|nr:acyl-CoA dehydrogenase family protein [Candidatus Calescibacterium sp.]